MGVTSKRGCFGKILVHAIYIPFVEGDASSDPVANLCSKSVPVALVVSSLAQYQVQGYRDSFWVEKHEARHALIQIAIPSGYLFQPVGDQCLGRGLRRRVSLS